MPRRRFGLILLVVISLACLGNHGCPQEFQSAQESPGSTAALGDFHIQLDTAYDGTIIWNVQVPQAVQGPNQVVFGFPFPLQPFVADIVGTHNVNEDFRNPIERTVQRPQAQLDPGLHRFLRRRALRSRSRLRDRTGHGSGPNRGGADVPQSERPRVGPVLHSGSPRGVCIRRI